MERSQEICGIILRGFGKESCLSVEYQSIVSMMINNTFHDKKVAILITREIIIMSTVVTGFELEMNLNTLEIREDLAFDKILNQYNHLISPKDGILYVQGKEPV